MIDFDQILDWKRSGFYPYFPVIESASSSKVKVRGSGEVYMLASCDYLGLSNDSRMKQAAIDAIARFGTNVCGSVAFSGLTEIHEALQHEIAEFMGMEAAVIFPTSYLANIGLLTTIGESEHLLVLDASNHVSIFHGARLSGAKIRTFPHLDYNALEGILRRSRDARSAFVITDGLFSADGDYADLERICAIAKRYDAKVVVDAAHDIGTLGRNGRGLAEDRGVIDSVDFIVGTMSKAMGSTGGFVTGRAPALELLRHFAAPHTSSRVVSPGVAAASLKAIEIVKREGVPRREVLARNVDALWRGLCDIGFKTSRTGSPVIPIYVNGPRSAVKAAAQLQAEGICVCAMVSPSVPTGGDRLRLNVTNLFDAADIAEILDIFARSFESPAYADCFA